jgi:hypothetical protein
VDPTNPREHYLIEFQFISHYACYFIFYLLSLNRMQLSLKHPYLRLSNDVQVALDR